ncbi:hypothetical protein GCM10007304_06190 [Rhodococcoides trifolii]|uniref:Lipoprotein n=1 Tax=Rhodococcoides trifolii TaxID=908250 RepID=A0A917CR65_9NOCA|nr:hypothetical protein [Rhodococcus trifolii]GGF95132.1 hypothetical protein GCM10007304_06190 [Rhodococcus trifolii]
MTHSNRVRAAVATAAVAVAMTVGSCSSDKVVTSTPAESVPSTVSSVETTVPRIDLPDTPVPDTPVPDSSVEEAERTAPTAPSGNVHPSRPGSEEVAVDPASYLRGNGYYVVSPSGNVFCGLFPDGSSAGFVGCQAGSSVAPTDGPQCGNAGNSTYAVRVEQAGAVHFCTNQGIYAAGADTPVLNYGEIITVGPVYCVSREEGMSCALTGSNAFLLSREQNYTYR